MNFIYLVRIRLWSGSVSNKFQVSVPTFLDTCQCTRKKRIDLTKHWKNLREVLVPKIEVARHDVGVVRVVLEEGVDHDLLNAPHFKGVFLRFALPFVYALSSAHSKLYDLYIRLVLQLEEIFGFGEEAHIVRKMHSIQEFDPKLVAPTANSTTCTFVSIAEDALFAQRARTKRASTAKSVSFDDERDTVK
jgi:hypothetical protein